jgi:hypothetical protein
VSKETYYRVKRDLIPCQKRLSSVKRDLIEREHLVGDEVKRDWCACPVLQLLVDISTDC